MSDASATHRAIEAVWRMESARVIAGLARVLRGDVGLAEEVAQDALLAAMEQWPASGIPENPAAWLTAAAKHRAIDAVRRHQRFKLVLEDVAREGEATLVGSRDGAAVAGVDGALDGEVQDDLLRLMFTACHPILPDEARTALALRLLCGLTTEEIGRAFLVPEATIAQRIVRAKRMLAEEEVPFEVPAGAELNERLGSVLQVIYLLFNEGYSAMAGDDWMRPALCEEAVRLGRVLAGLMPGEAEVHGLVGLMEIQASRSGARVDGAGKPILLLEQDRALWDGLLIRRGLTALERARGLGSELGPYGLQAAIAACHARARDAADTPWGEIARLYGELGRVSPSPIVELNRAVAVGMAFGPRAGLEMVDRVAEEPVLQGYHLLPSVRGDLLRKLGRVREARVQFERAASLARNVRERELLVRRARECAAGDGDGGGR